MIEYRSGNILEADVEALVNSVNCVGVMGRGISLQFRKTWPENFKAYVRACRRGEVRPGKMFVFETSSLTNPRYIINFPTKRHWRGKSRIEDIEAGLRALVDEIRSRGIRSIAIPPLGCGLGGLDWGEVRALIDQALGDLPGVHVIVFEPTRAEPLPKSMRRGEVPKMTPGRAALIGLMDRYLRGLLDPFVSLLELHKLMYFMQEAGEPLKLRFAKGPYGPYAENLRHVLHAIEGHYISGYMPGKKLIEVALPLPEINDASAYDKMPGIGAHPKGIHHWWARLPLPVAGRCSSPRWSTTRRATRRSSPRRRRRSGNESGSSGSSGG
jgi:O-acetyl-ADP-ribose deacetylase (regulator of RNase III)